MRFLTFLLSGSVPFLVDPETNVIRWTQPDVKVATKPVPPKGDGVFSIDNIPEGTFICQYHGEILTTEQEEELYPDRYPEYCLQISPNLSIDGMNSNHFSRFINHHQNANLQLHTNAQHRIAYFTASKDIPSNEELCFDYGVAYFIFRGITPAPETESRPLEMPNPKVSMREIEAEAPPPPPPTTRLEIQELLSESNNDVDEKRKLIMRGLDFYGGVQWETDDLVEIPVNLSGKRETILYSSLSLTDLSEILGKLCDERVKRETASQ